MGGVFSKKASKVSPEALPPPRVSTSAPARLDGLDGMDPPTPASGKKGAFTDGPEVDASVLVSPQRHARAMSADAAFANAGPLDNKPHVHKIDAVGAQTDGSGLAAAFKSASTGPIPPEALAWAAVFGEHAIRELHSPDWKNREEGLHAVIRALQNAKFHALHDSAETWDATCSILCRSLKDKVAPLYFTALEVFDAAMSAFTSRVVPKHLASGIDTFLITVLNRCGNTNARISETSTQAVLSIANQPVLGTAYLGPHVLAALPSAKGGVVAAGHALLAGRLELIATLMAATRSSRGMSTEAVLAFCRPALETPDDKVRFAAVRTVGEVYRLRSMVGDRLQLEVLLPGLKPALLQVLQRRCEEVSGEIVNGGGMAGSGGGMGGGGVMGSGMASSSGRDNMPVGGGMGIQVFGKGLSSLPPLPPRGGGAFLPALAGASRRDWAPGAPEKETAPLALFGGGNGEAATDDSNALGGGMERAKLPPPPLRARNRMPAFDANAPAVPAPPAPLTPGRSSPSRSSPSRSRPPPTPPQQSSTSGAPTGPAPSSPSIVSRSMSNKKSRQAASEEFVLGGPSTPPTATRPPPAPKAATSSPKAAPGSAPRGPVRGAGAPRSGGSGGGLQAPGSPKVLDDAEEFLIESILNADARRF